MKTGESLLSRIEIASPCDVGWESMTGDERIRHCQLCNLNVYNIVEMSTTEAEAFLLANISSERVCARIFRRKDGTIITDDCPRGLRAARNAVRGAYRRAAAVAAVILATFGVASPDARAAGGSSTQAGAIIINPNKSPAKAETKNFGDLDPVKVTLNYIAIAQKVINETWKLPDGANKGIAIRFKIQRDGSATDLKVTTSSGDAELDAAALTAVRDCAFARVPEVSPAPVVVLHSFEPN